MQGLPTVQLNRDQQHALSEVMAHPDLPEEQDIPMEVSFKKFKGKTFALVNKLWLLEDGTFSTEPR